MEQERDAVEEFFAHLPLGPDAFDAVAAIVDGCGPAAVRVTPSQVAFRRRTGFAFLWLPGRWLTNPDAEVVLSLGLRRRDHDPRWKEVVQTGPSRWTHHLELHTVDDIDAQVADWLAEAYRGAA